MTVFDHHLCQLTMRQLKSWLMVLFVYLTAVVCYLSWFGFEREGRLPGSSHIAGGMETETQKGMEIDPEDVGLKDSCTFWPGDLARNSLRSVMCEISLERILRSVHHHLH